MAEFVQGSNTLSLSLSLSLVANNLPLLHLSIVHASANCASYTSIVVVVKLLATGGSILPKRSPDYYHNYNPDPI